MISHFGFHFIDGVQRGGCDHHRRDPRACHVKPLGDF